MNLCHLFFLDHPKEPLYPSDWGENFSPIDLATIAVGVAA